MRNQEPRGHTKAETLNPPLAHDGLPPIAVTLDRAVGQSGIGRSKIYEAIRKGTLPARKSGSRTLILYADLKQYLESLPVVEVAQ